jgi:predicted dehydrogenase
MPVTYAVTLIWNIRPIDPQDNSEETAVVLITAESEDDAVEQAIASCAQEDEPHDAFAIQYDEVSYRRYGQTRNGEYGELGLVAAY